MSGAFPAPEDLHAGHANVGSKPDKTRLRPLGFGAAAVARFGPKIVAGLPSRSSRKRAKVGGRTRTRTLDPLIKSQLLYQLSYAPFARKPDPSQEAEPEGGLLHVLDEAPPM